MRIDEIEVRKAEIRELLENPAEDLNIAELTEEVRGLNSELEEIRKNQAMEAELRTAVAPAVVEEIKNNKKEERKMENVEIRNTQEYINAYANYMKTGKDEECRALLSANNNSGTVPVPAIVEEKIRHAWDNEDIMQRVRKTYVKGNLKVGFEKSATGAVIHTEGDNAPSEEELVLGVVTLTPASIKKWITVSDEALDLTGQAFLDYVIEELSYQIAKKAADEMVAKIVAAPATSTATAAAAASVTASTIAASTIAEALGKLSDEARNPVIIMNKATYPAFKAVQYANNYGVDVFEGLTVLFNNSLTAFSAASSNDCYAIVGDLGMGAQANFPNGAEIGIKIDDLSLAEKDLVKFVGREYVGLGVVAPFAFAKICK